MGDWQSTGKWGVGAKTVPEELTIVPTPSIESRGVFSADRVASKAGRKLSYLLVNGADHCFRIIIYNLQQDPGWTSWRTKPLLPMTQRA